MWTCIKQAAGWTAVTCRFAKHTSLLRSRSLADPPILPPTYLPCSSGWRTFKRPGVDDFIRTMSQYYELVLYTSQLPTYADPILDRLDPQRTIQYRCARWCQCLPAAAV